MEYDSVKQARGNSNRDSTVTAVSGVAMVLRVLS